MIKSLIEQYKPELKGLVVQDLKSKLATEIKSLEQEHRTLSQEYRQQKDVVAEINTNLANAKGDDDKKALEVRKSVADGEEAKLLDKLRKIEQERNKYDNRLTDLADNNAEYDAIMGKTATASKTPTKESSSSEDELTASSPVLQAEKMFDTFMKRWQADVLSGMNDQQLQEYVKNDLEEMKKQFMSEGKQWKLIGKKSDRESPKVMAIFDIMDKKGVATLKELADEITQQRTVGMGIIRKKNESQSKNRR